MPEPEPLVITCFSCGSKLRTPRTTIGTSVGCPTCQASVPVRDPSSVTPMIVDPKRKLGLAPRGESAPVADPSFKDRLRTTADASLQVDPNNPVMIRRDLRKARHGDTLTNWETKPKASRRQARSRQLIFVLSGTAALATAALIVIFWQRLSAPHSQASSPTTPPGDVPLELQATSDFRSQVWDVVSRFATASKPEDFLPFIRDRERVEPLVRKFYTKDNPWTPLALAKKPDLSSLAVHRSFVVFDLPLQDFSTLPIALEQSPTGFLVDWESFVAYSDLSWSALREQRPRQPVLLRAVLRPMDYWNMDFPSAATHRCFQLSDKHSDNTLYGYVLKGSPVEARIAKTLLTAAYVNVVLNVKYPEKSTNDRQVEITDVLEKGWIFRDDDLPETSLDVSLDQPASKEALPVNAGSSTVLPGLKP
jgi:hypothetical protein